MHKKVISIAFLICLIFSISVMAENENPISRGTAPQVSKEIPQDVAENPQEEQGNAGVLPSEDNLQMPDNNQRFGGQMPGGMGGFHGNMQNFNGQTHKEVPTDFLGFVKTYSTPITSVILLASAFIFVIFYRRKNY